MGSKIVYANIYEISRHYGGPEEGGWWYNWDTCLEVYPVRKENSDLIREELEKEYSHINRGDIYSVNGGRLLSIRIEDKPKESETTERPFYE